MGREREGEEKGSEREIMGREGKRQGKGG